MVRKSLGIGAAPGSREAAASTLPHHSGRGNKREGDIPRSTARTWEARVDLIVAILVGIAGVLGAAFSKQAADEFKAWTPRLLAAVVQCAIRRLPEDQRERYAEEWRSHIDETPGEIGKLIVGLGLLPAARKLSRISPNPRLHQIEEIVTAMRDAVRWTKQDYIVQVATLPAAQER